MDKAGIDMQVLSLSTPGCEQFSPARGMALSRKTNEEMYKVINKHPDRFIGLAALAPQSPEEAARFIDSIPASDSDKEKIQHSVAEKLFKLAQT